MKFVLKGYDSVEITRGFISSALNISEDDAEKILNRLTIYVEPCIGKRREISLARIVYLGETWSNMRTDERNDYVERQNEICKQNRLSCVRELENLVIKAFPEYFSEGPSVSEEVLSSFLKTPVTYSLEGDARTQTNSILEVENSDLIPEVRRKLKKIGIDTTSSFQGIDDISIPWLFLPRLKNNLKKLGYDVNRPSHRADRFGRPSIDDMIQSVRMLSNPNPSLDDRMQNLRAMGSNLPDPTFDDIVQPFRAAVSNQVRNWDVPLPMDILSPARDVRFSQEALGTTAMAAEAKADETIPSLLAELGYVTQQYAANLTICDTLNIINITKIEFPRDTPFQVIESLCEKMQRSGLKCKASKSEMRYFKDSLDISLNVTDLKNWLLAQRPEERKEALSPRKIAGS